MDFFDEWYLTELDLGEDIDSELYHASRDVSASRKHRLGGMGELSDELWDDQAWDELY